MKNIDVCLTPDLLHLHKDTLENSIVVVADVFRATSCMVTAFAHGVDCIIPVATIEECRQWQERGYYGAAERNAKMVEGFELNNSPFSYMDERLRGAKIAMTTTNGTLAITRSRNAVKVLVGSFLNLEAVARYLRSQSYDVLVLCAGWKGRPNLEDTLFAGALIERLKEEYSMMEDSAIMAWRMYNQGKNNLPHFLANSSHIRRLQRLGIHKDITYCLQHDLFDVVPVLRGNTLVCIEV
ncbi:2-phosphosulfolactate phosphatase family protein [Nibrella viscosa]|uniref:Probable 2-phosphosulfolactate phosphatase n=1 Tax=Nibrella viscosa TaxID=1084524 RepID=A0ABP8KRX7_9BACT